MKRVLVIGATGMLGHALCRHLRGGAFDLWATARNKWRDDKRLEHVIGEDRCVGNCDFARDIDVERVLAHVCPTVAVNCVGLVKQRPEAANEELAITINALAPHRLARLCDNVGAKLIQLGTDCVFSGKRGAYNESDEPDPVDLYGRSKLLGEVTRAPHLTLRTSMIGWQLAGTEGLAEWFWSRRGGRAEGWTGAVFSGLTTYALADVIARVISEHVELTGLYHVAAAPISKYDLLLILNDACGRPVELSRVAGLSIDRSLDGAKFATATGIYAPAWDAMVEEMVRRRSDYA